MTRRGNARVITVVRLECLCQTWPDRNWKISTTLVLRSHRQLKELCLHAGVAQLGEQQTEALSILEVPCSIHGPGNVFIFP